jgi:hypothetical protein
MQGMEEDGVEWLLFIVVPPFIIQVLGVVEKQQPVECMTLEHMSQTD